MTDPQNPEPTNELPFSRRDVLKTVGGASVISALGTGNTTAQPSQEVIVGTEPGHADDAKGPATSVRKTIDFGHKIGEATVGRWPEQALKGLKNNPHVRYIEENGTMQTGQQTLTYNIDRVDAEIAHTNGNTGSGVDLAILDTGIDTDHDDLPSLGTSHAFINCSGSDCDADWDDDHSHGTHVAGIAAALDNTEDVVGVAPGVTLHAIKVCDGSGNCPYDVLADGIREAADQGYDVANMSIWGGHSDCVHDAVEYATDESEDRYVVLVAITGNGGPCTDCVSHPAAIDEVIAVSSTDDQDNLANSSSQGPETDFAAPGDGVLSTVPGGTGTKSGTSMAAPNVAGAAAQLIADGTAASSVKGELQSTAEDIGLSDNEQGAGLVDVAAALGHDSANDLTEVETDFALDRQYSSARLTGDVTELTGNDSAEVFFQYREAGTGSWTTTPTETLTSTGSFDRTVTGLEEDTSYEFRAGVTVTESSEGWSSTEHGDVEDFDTADNPDPTALFSHDPVVPDPGDVVEFDATESKPGEILSVDEDDSIVSYEWDFGDGTTATTSDPIIEHTYSDAGDVTVRLRVTDEFDQTDETTETLRINALPGAAFTHTPTLPNEDEQIEFDASASMDLDGDIVEYAWDFDDGSVETTTAPIRRHTYDIGDYGERDVTLTVTDNDDATDEVTETIRINAVPEADFEHSPTLPNEDEPVEFDASASADRDPEFGGEIVEYEWDFGDGTTKTTTDPVIEHTYAIGDYGNQTVTLRVTDNDGASHDDLSVHEETIRVNAVPEADFEVVTDPPVRNEPVEFDASASTDRDPEFGGEIVEYEWDFGDATTETTTDPVIGHTFTTGGEHTVTLRVTDNDGASHDDLSVHEETFTVYIRIGVTIQPNESPNSINPNRNGNVPVAVLHTSAFDPPARLDHATVRFGDPDDVGFDTSTDPFTPEEGATPAHSSGHVEDIDGDGDLDSLFHFPVPDTGFESNDVEGKLVGLTDDGVPVFGSDSVNIAGGGRS